MGESAEQVRAGGAFCHWPMNEEEFTPVAKTSQFSFMQMITNSKMEAISSCCNLDKCQILTGENV